MEGDHANEMASRPLGLGRATEGSNELIVVSTKEPVTERCGDHLSLVSSFLLTDRGFLYKLLLDGSVALLDLQV